MTNTKCRWCGIDFDTHGPEDKKRYESGCPKHPWNRYFTWLQEFHYPSYILGAVVTGICCYIVIHYN